MADHVDIPIDQFSDICYTFQALQIDQTPLDLTTATDVILTVKETLTSKTPLDTYSLADNIRITNPTNGEWDVTFPSLRTAAYPSNPLVYDVYLVFGTKRYRACQGSVLPNKNVTGV